VARRRRNGGAETQCEGGCKQVPHTKTSGGLRWIHPVREMKG